MEREYRVYRITSPAGRMYIGYTSMPVSERWRHHVKRADSEKTSEHPFYRELRQYGAAAFHVETTDVAYDLREAMEKERLRIAQCPEDLRMNLSPGGWDDAWFGRKQFWQRMKDNPEARAAYLKKLSDVKKADDWSDYTIMSQRATEWRKNNPREMYKQAYRASRMSRRDRPQPLSAPPETQEERKRRLMWKYRRSKMTRKSALCQWAARSSEERAAIGAKISKTQKARAIAITDPEERCALTEKARAAIDRTIQGKAASAGLKRFWAELKSDPERYSEYIQRRRATLKETNNRRKSCEPMT